MRWRWRRGPGPRQAWYQVHLREPGADEWVPLGGAAPAALLGMPLGRWAQRRASNLTAIVGAPVDLVIGCWDHRPNPIEHPPPAYQLQVGHDRLPVSLEGSFDE